MKRKTIYNTNTKPLLKYENFVFKSLMEPEIGTVSSSEETYYVSNNYCRPFNNVRCIGDSDIRTEHLGKVVLHKIKDINYNSFILAFCTNIYCIGKTTNVLDENNRPRIITTEKQRCIGEVLSVNRDIESIYNLNHIDASNYFGEAVFHKINSNLYEDSKNSAPVSYIKLYCPLQFRMEIINAWAISYNYILDLRNAIDSFDYSIRDIESIMLYPQDTWEVNMAIYSKK